MPIRKSFLCRMKEKNLHKKLDKVREALENSTGNFRNPSPRSHDLCAI